jgi:hypothetical protein
MSAIVIIAIVLGVFFAIGLAGGVILMIAWPSRQAHRWARLSAPADRRPDRPDHERNDDEWEEPSRWPDRD